MLLIGVWYGMYALEVFRPGLLPSPAEVLTTMIERFQSGQIVDDIYASIRRVFIGVIVGLVAAVPVGFVLGWYRTPRAMFDPLVNFLRALPPIALIPLVIVYFGIGEFARTSVLVYAAFFASIIVIYEGVVAIEERYVRAALTLGASEWEIFSKVALPLSVPTILVALRVALGVSKECSLRSVRSTISLSQRNFSTQRSILKPMRRLSKRMSTDVDSPAKCQ